MTYSLLTRTAKGGKLTIPEMDGNLLYLRDLALSGSGPTGPQGIAGTQGKDGATGPQGSGGGGTSQIFTVSVLEAVALSASSSIVPGSLYYISDVHTNLYGGNKILLEGLSTNQFSTNGYGEFFNPKYSSFSMWDSRDTATYSIGESRIFGGKVWTSITGTTSNTDSFFTLNPGDWASQSFSNSTYYNTVWDEITYDITNDLILSRYESYSNNRVTTTFETADWLWCGIHPIFAFRWGDPWDNNTNTGVGSCNVNNGYLNCLNYVSGSMNAIEVSNYAIIGEIAMYNNSYLEKITVDNSSYLLFNSLDSTGLYNLNITNNSFIIGIICTNSTIYDITLSNNSGLDQTSLSNSTLENLNLSNDSTFYNNNINNTTLSNWVCNRSNFSYNLINSSSIDGLICSMNGFGSNTINSCYLFTLNLEDSQFSSLTITSSSLENIVIKGFYFGGYTLTNEILMQAVFQYGDITYQIQRNFSGGTNTGGVGNFALGALPVPAGFFIHSVMIDCVGLGYSGSPIINIGLDIAGNSGINDANGVISFLNNKVNVFDVSNGEIIPVKGVNANSFVQASISGNNITSGNINLEIKLKYINYNYVND